MITEEQYINYFENLCKQHKVIQHEVDGRDAFFYIPVETDLTEFDNALRGDVSSPLLCIDALRGGISDAQSDRHLQQIDGQFYVLAASEQGNRATIRRVQDDCLRIGMEVLERVKIDLKRTDVLGVGARFILNNVQYDPVGPINAKYFGYTFRFAITCPFGFSVNGAIWADK